MTRACSQKFITLSPRLSRLIIGGERLSGVFGNQRPTWDHRTQHGYEDAETTGREATVTSTERSAALRAVVVDDSRFMRGLITEALASGGVDVVETAADGREAVEVVCEREPDVVTMDVEMPEMDGIDAVEEIMRRQPTPVLMLSAHTGEGAETSFEALDRGAVDVFAKPGGEVSVGVSRLADQLVETVRAVAAADVTRVEGTDPTGSEQTAGTRPDHGGRAETLVVVGASTGGPNAVERVLASLPTARLSVIVVQHMPAGFTDRFAERLDDRSGFDVREASDGDRVGPGEALVVPGDHHLEVSHANGARARVSLDVDERGEPIQPAVDVTMRSAADVVDGPLVGVVLTGMGSDGAAGIEAIHAVGGRTIAQDEATSAIYGMPKRAVETGAVDRVLPIGEIAGGVVDAAERFPEEVA
jgi:two-component system chemotaxis response regulator CheB